MAQSVDGLYLNKYVDPQLLIERRNYRADFMQVLGSVPAGALAADGVRRNKLINNVGFRVNNTEDFEPKQMTGKNYIVPWEIYDTEPSSCTDDEIRYLAFDKRAAIRVKHKPFRSVSATMCCTNWLRRMIQTKKCLLSGQRVRKILMVV